MRRQVDTTFQEGPKTADREKLDFPAAFRSVWEGLGTCSGHLKAVMGGLDGRRLSSARRNARAARPRNHCRIRPAARWARQAARNRCRRVLGTAKRKGRQQICSAYRHRDTSRLYHGLPPIAGGEGLRLEWVSGPWSGRIARDETRSTQSSKKTRSSLPKSL